MFKQVKNLKKEFESASVYKKEKHRFGKINDYRHKNLILGVGKNATGPLGRTKKQIVKGNAIKNAVADLIKEIDPDIMVEDAKFRNSSSLVVMVSPAEKALILNEMRGNIRIELEDYMGDKGVSNIPGSITFTGMELGFRDLEETLQRYDTEIRLKTEQMDRVEEKKVDMMDFVDGLGTQKLYEKSAKEVLQHNHSEKIKHWETGTSPLLPITGIDHKSYENQIMANYGKFRSMARYLDEHSLESAAGRFDRHPYEYEIEKSKKSDLVDKRTEFQYGFQNRTREEIEKEEREAEFVPFRPRPESTAF